MLNDRILLDTCAYSAFKKNHKEIVKTIEQAYEVYFNPIVLGELDAGFRYKQQKKRQDELTEFLDSFRVKIIPIDKGTIEPYSVITNSLWKAGTPLAADDIWIAASAMQHGLTVLTTDADFQKIPQIMILHYKP